MNMKERLEVSTQRKLNDAISSIENKPQINVAGIKNELEAIVRPEGAEPLASNLPLPSVYQELRSYYDMACEALETGETFHNQTGALQTLKAIKQKYF